jgi:hypothetical protein
MSALGQKRTSRPQHNSCWNVQLEKAPLRGNSEGRVRCTIAGIPTGSLNYFKEKAFPNYRTVELKIFSVAISIV